MTDPKYVRGITDKILQLWELNPTWTIGQVIDRAHFTAQVDAGNYTLDEISDEDFEAGLDVLIEQSKAPGGFHGH